MTPTKHNLTIYRGRDFTKDFTFKDEDGNLEDISLWTFTSEVRSGNCQSSALLATFSISVDILTATITLTLTNIQTLTIPEGIAYWDLLVTIGTDDQTYISGKVKSMCTVTEVP